jgi:Mg-chelatase subunit ChlD
MLLVHASEPTDLVHAAIDDPRRLLMDLATGRLLTRKFVLREERRVERTRLVGEARIYVLDASTSMLEQGQEQSRARMRDAILIAELATMLRRQAEHDRSVRLSFFYRFFTKKLGDVVKVSTPQEVVAAMADVIGTTRTGGTDIQSALLSSFELIRFAKASDPDLARASIVLVTDGQAPIDPEILRKAREEAGNVAIAVSVIALGEENPILRDLVARQRARGERAFYHYVDDARLVALCKGMTHVGRSPHAPGGSPESLDALRSALEDVVIELDDLGAKRPSDDAAGVASEGARALEDAAARDVAAVGRRYDRWFPPAPTEEAPAEAPTASVADDLEATRVVLASVAEVVGELAGDPLHKKADAIELIERLLPDARLTPARYAEVVTNEALRLRDALAAVHGAVASANATAGFDHKLASGSKR